MHFVTLCVTRCMPTRNGTIVSPLDM